MTRNATVARTEGITNLKWITEHVDRHRKYKPPRGNRKLREELRYEARVDGVDPLTGGMNMETLCTHNENLLSGPL